MAQHTVARTAREGRARGLAAVAAVAGALAVFAVIEVVVGVDLRQPLRPPATVAGDVNAVGVVIAAVVAALAGCGLLAALERLTTRARTIWTAVAVTVLVMSLGGPFSGVSSTANRAGLLALHLAVGTVLIPMLARTARRSR